jgi:hypothetical protein
MSRKFGQPRFEFLAQLLSLHLNEAQISPIQDARNSDMALFAEFAVRCVLDCSCPLSSAEGGDFLEASGWA